MQDADGAGRWLSFPELAEARGISIVSAGRLVRRRKWERRPGNDGTVRILVPAGEDTRSDGRSDSRPDSRSGRPDGRSDVSRAINTLGEAIAALREQLARAEARADRLQEELLRAHVEAAARRSWLFWFRK
jgi:hypothetical protein